MSSLLAIPTLVLGWVGKRHREELARVHGKLKKAHKEEMNRFSGERVGSTVGDSDLYVPSTNVLECLSPPVLP